MKRKIFFLLLLFLGVFVGCDAAINMNGKVMSVSSGQFVYQDGNLISNYNADIDLVWAACEKTVTELKGKDIQKERKISTARYGAIIITADVDEALELANIFAPEHLELMVEDPAGVLGKVCNAGAVFLGSFTPEALGDYMAGTNHILPTAGTARFSSGLGVYDFVKRRSVLNFSSEALGKLGSKTAHIAQMEGLDAHANSVNIRIKSMTLAENKRREV